MKESKIDNQNALKSPSTCLSESREGISQKNCLSAVPSQGQNQSKKKQNICLSPEDILRENYPSDLICKTQLSGFTNTIPWSQKWLDKDVWSRWGNSNPT